MKLNRRTSLCRLSPEYMRLWKCSFLITLQVINDRNRAKRFANAAVAGIIEADRELGYLT